MQQGMYVLRQLASLSALVLAWTRAIKQAVNKPKKLSEHWYVAISQERVRATRCSYTNGMRDNPEHTFRACCCLTVF